MRHSLWLAALLLLTVFAVSPFFLVKVIYYTDDIFFGVSKAFFSSSTPQPAFIDEVVFVGDIMLARHVETLMNMNGSEYPYQHLKSKESQLWVGNFEAAVPNRHQKTPNFTFTFSVAERHLLALREFGFSHLGLANNHTYDFGREGFEETKNNLKDFQIFGSPVEITETSITYIQIADKMIGVLAINSVGRAINENTLKGVLDVMVQNSDFQIAYIHWGDEYMLEHNERQEDLAHSVIELGVDAVIGHHPHVVQDIGIYKGKPIFYSLGNFIFDQYFSEDVQQGLALSAKLNGEQLEFTFVPISSIHSHAAPKIMESNEQTAFLLSLAKRSDVELFSSILNGVITVTK